MERLWLSSGLIIMSGNWLLVEMRLSFKDEGQRFIPEYRGTLLDDVNPWRIFVQEAEVEGEVCGHSHGSTRPARCCGRLSTHSLQMLQVSVMGDDKPAVCPSMTVSSDVQPRGGGHV